MKKLFAFDVDGTLLPHGGVMPKENKEAIQLIKDNGDIAILATGRPAPIWTKDICDQVGIDVIAVGSNGGAIYDIQKETTEYLGLISNSDMLKLWKLIKTHDPHLSVHTKTYSYDVTKENQDVDSFKTDLLEVRKASIEQIMMLNPDNEITMFAISAKGKAKTLQALLEKEIPNLTWRPNGDSWLDGSGTDINKWEAVSKVAKDLNIDEENIYTFGDSYNDMELIGKCKNGIAMGNAVKELKDVASKTIGSCDKPSLYKFIKALYKKK